MERQINLTDNPTIVDMPTDSFLPGLSTMLDSKAVFALLKEHMRLAGGRIIACRIPYIRYKPQTNCLIVYALEIVNPADSQPRPHILYGKCFGKEDYQIAVNKLKFRHPVENGVMPAAIMLPELQAVICSLANDHSLPAMATILNARKLRRVLYDCLKCYSKTKWRISHKNLRTEVIRFKPEKRAVFRIATHITELDSNRRFPLVLYARAYSDNRGRAIFEISEQLFATLKQADKLSVPEPLIYDDEKNYMLISAVPGEPLTARLQDRNTPSLVSETASALRQFHRIHAESAPLRTNATVLEDVQATAQSLLCLIPECESPIKQVVTSIREFLESGEPSIVGLVHGDFYHGQVLANGKKISFIDFDRAYRGETLADLGNFCAHLHLLKLRGSIASSEELINSFIQAYADAGGSVDQRRLTNWIVLGLFQLSVAPFRVFIANWKREIEAILNLCKEILI